MHTDGDELAGVEDEAPDTGEPEESVTDTQIVATARLPEDEDSGDWYDDDVDAADSAGQPDDHDAPVARAETGDAPIAHTETGSAPIAQAETGDAPIAQTETGSAPTQTSDAWLDAPDDEGLWVERALGLETELATAASDADRVAILLEIATIWRDQLAERDAAASAFERVLEIDARNDEAFSGLESIYSLQRESAKLVTLLLHGAEHSESVADRVEHMQRVAHLYEQHGQPDKALLVLDAALDVAPDNPPLAAEIARLRDTAAALYEQQGGPPTPDPLVQRSASR